MIITIDTSKDSAEEIEKAIHFLSTLINISMQPPPQEITPQAGEAFTQLFDAAEQQPIIEDKKEEPPAKVMTYTW